MLANEFLNALDIIYDAVGKNYLTEEDLEFQRRVYEFIKEYEKTVDSEPDNVFRSRISTAENEYAEVSEWIKKHPNTCVYCGDPSTEKDHLLPLSWTGKAARRWVPTVPSCRSCNSILSDFPDPRIYERCQLIADTIGNQRYEVLRAGGAPNVY